MAFSNSGLLKSYLLTSIAVLALSTGCNNDFRSFPALALNEQSSLTQVSTTQQNLPDRVARITKLNAGDSLMNMINASPGVVVIDFYADWCGPCKKQSQIFEGLRQFAITNQASVIKINVDDHQELANKFRVSGLPTLIVVKDGKIIDRKIGFTNEEKTKEILMR